jgi:hypothetical protein
MDVTEIEAGKDSVPKFWTLESGFRFAHGPSERAARGAKIMRRSAAQQ